MISFWFPVTKFRLWKIYFHHFCIKVRIMEKKYSIPHEHAKSFHQVFSITNVICEGCCLFQRYIKILFSYSGTFTHFLYIIVKTCWKKYLNVFIIFIFWFLTICDFKSYTMKVYFKTPDFSLLEEYLKHEWLLLLIFCPLYVCTICHSCFLVEHNFWQYIKYLNS